MPDFLPLEKAKKKTQTCSSAHPQPFGWEVSISYVTQAFLLQLQKTAQMKLKESTRLFDSI